MTLIALDDLEAGMTTARNVLNRRGQVLLPKDTTLSEKHIRGLRTWSILFVDVLDADDAQLAELSEDQQILLEDTLLRYFSQNTENIDHPFIQFLRELYTEHLWKLVHQEAIPTLDSVIDEPSPIEKWLTAAQLISNITAIPTLPEIKDKLIAQLGQPDASVSQIGEILVMAPGLSAVALKMSNSAWYGANSKPNNVSHAVSVIGFDELKRFVQESATVSSYFDDNSLCASPYTFWGHSIATAIFAQVIAQQVNHPEPEYLMLLGLLHDLGKQLLFLKLPEQYRHICRFAWQEQVPSMKIERKYLGFYHNLLTMELLKQWNFSKAFQDVVYFHHTPENATHKTEAYILHLADLFANAMGFSVQRLTVLPTIDIQALSEIQLSKRHLPAIVVRAEQTIFTIRRNFNIS